MIVRMQDRKNEVRTDSESYFVDFEVIFLQRINSDSCLEMGNAQTQAGLGL
jgi:hypothetical protein